MKNFIILFIGLITVSCCYKQESKSNETVKIKFPIDSVLLTEYERNEEVSGIKLVPRKRNNSEGSFLYYFLTKGNGGYFVFILIDYDYLMSLFGERWPYQFQYAYQIFKSDEILKYFNDVSDYIIDLKLIDTFTISVNDLNYKIEKYYKPLYVLEKNGRVDNNQYHYLNDELGLIAIDSYFRILVATHNSAVEDSIMTYISKKVIENIELNEYGNVSD